MKKSRYKVTDETGLEIQPGDLIKVTSFGPEDPRHGQLWRFMSCTHPRKIMVQEQDGTLVREFFNSLFGLKISERFQAEDVNGNPLNEGDSVFLVGASRFDYRYGERVFFRSCADDEKINVTWPGDPSNDHPQSMPARWFRVTIKSTE